MQNACYGIPTEMIAALCQVDIATARRWKSGASRLPYAAACLLSGDLGAFRGQHWRGWKIQGEDIASPDGWVINRNHALSVPLMEAQIKQRDALIQQLRAEVEYLKSVHALADQPAPPSSLPEINTG